MRDIVDSFARLQKYIEIIALAENNSSLQASSILFFFLVILCILIDIFFFLNQVAQLRVTPRVLVGHSFGGKGT